MKKETTTTKTTAVKVTAIARAKKIEKLIKRLKSA